MSTRTTAQTTATAKAATMPIRIVLRRDASGNLQQDSLTAAERQQLRDRYDEIDAGPPGQAAPFYEAFYHAARHHPGDPEPLIMVSRANMDEMTWEIVDQSGVAETDFEVSIMPENGSPADPLPDFPKKSGADNKVHSGQPKSTHVRHHYKFEVVAKDGKKFDPDWYAAD